jgi:hypothetical protein
MGALHLQIEGRAWTGTCGEGGNNTAAERVAASGELGIEASQPPAMTIALMTSLFCPRVD